MCASNFPQNPDIFKCETENCPGLRYKGSTASQLKAGRQPRAFFVLGDIESQLRSLLERKGVWDIIQTTKDQTKTGTAPSYLGDIVDGEQYRKLCRSGQFLHDSNNISVIFNTDGVPLYSSSGVKLWPIFIAVNELSPSERFSRDNVILAGIWQGKGNPPFLNYMCSFGEEMVRLYNDGFYITIGGQRINVHVGLLLGTFDLQAKAYVLNMTMFNGQYGCITCEEEGQTVPQGKGYARCYPHRTANERRPIRNSDSLKYEIGSEASLSGKRIKGICGVSGLAVVPWLDIVLGTVPDYMHGVLMGVTKTLLQKWFSTTNSKKPYFIGKYIHKISDRLSGIHPPDFVERLPRDLEKHYHHFKATELQNWLLFYGPVCLRGYLPDKYYHHFVSFSEAIHILLGDHISEEDLQRAEQLLDSFYMHFSEYYGAGSCGLNVHNIGAHLVFYTRLWGPLHCWSCFGFEDNNATILKAVHGTGDVTKQILRFKMTQLSISGVNVQSLPNTEVRKFLSTLAHQKSWKKLYQASNCVTAGRLSPCGTLENEAFLLVKTGAHSSGSLRKALRVIVRQQKVYSSEYTRMKRRICYFVVCEDGKMVAIDYFLLNTESNVVFLVGYLFVSMACSGTTRICGDVGNHIIRVEKTNDLVVFDVDVIVEKLIYLEIDDIAYVSNVPNKYGHGVFK